MGDLIHLFHPVGLKMTKHLPYGTLMVNGKRRREDDRASVDSCSFHSEMTSSFQSTSLPNVRYRPALTPRVGDAHLPHIWKEGED